MSKIVLICSPAGKPLSRNRWDLVQVLKQITPDNMTPRAPRVIEDAGVLIGILNPVESLPVHGTSVCMGQMFEETENWWEPGTGGVPDGTYALFRADAKRVELVSDAAGTRTIWYVVTEQAFIASTSQRAIVMLLGGFEFNREVIPWMLSSGTLGPGLSWDKRIHCLGADAHLVLDRTNWRVSVHRQPVQYEPLVLPDEEHRRRLQRVIEETFAGLKLDLSRWILPLSGGVDSRAILLMLHNRSGLKTITWGLKNALTDQDSDAWVAQRLAVHFDVPHRYFDTSPSSEPIEHVFDRFLVAGDGRCDHISGYIDGFAVWKHLCEAPYDGVIRGDELFGCRAVHSGADVYRNMSFQVLEDFANLRFVSDAMENILQERPSCLLQQNNDTLEVWRDRLNAEFEVPYLFAPLNDLKLPYVEIINPLLSKRIIQTVRQLPDHLRTNKSLFRKIVTDKSPSIKFARIPAIAEAKSFLKMRNVVNTIAESLTTGTCFQIFPKDMVNRVLNSLQVQNGKEMYPKRNHNIVLRAISKIQRRLHFGESPQFLSPNVLAFRMYLIVRMNQILTHDADALGLVDACGDPPVQSDGDTRHHLKRTIV